MRIRPPKVARDLSLLVAFSILDVLLIIAAVHYFRHAREQPPIESMAVISPAEDAALANELEKFAQTGSWAALEKARSERAARLLAAKTRPSRGTAVYFFPETLPERSLEREFANREIRAALEALRAAYDGRRGDEAQRAFRLLETRISNYELGARTPRAQTELSGEAQQFLRVYRSFTTFK